jgi:hypothetical protein
MSISSISCANEKYCGIGTWKFTKEEALLIYTLWCTKEMSNSCVDLAFLWAFYLQYKLTLLLTRNVTEWEATLC